MLPPALKSDYKEYKMDTNSIASWLASTAKLCGHSSSSLSQQTSAPAGRLKGKARKDAKEKAKSAAGTAGAAGAASSSSTSSTAPPPTRGLQKRIIAIKDFVPLAEFVAASRKPVVVVPVALMNTLARVIAVRTQFGVRMASAGVRGTSESDANHGYFVGVLQKVQAILQARVAATTTTTTTAAASTPETPTASAARTGFDALNMFQPSQAFEDAPDAPPVHRPEKPVDDDVVYEAEPLASWEDAVASFGLMMQDLSQIRGQIMDMWMLHTTDCRDLAAVAVAIQAATDFARLIMEDAEPIFAKHGGVMTVVDKFTTNYVMRKAQALAMAQKDKEMTPDGKVKVNMPFNYYDLSNEFFLGSGQFITELAGFAIPDCVPAFRRNVVGYYDPMLEEKALRPDQKFCRDKAILEMIWADAAVIASRIPEYPVEDEFLRGIRELNRTGNLPFMLIFAAQVLLDIHHLSRYHIGTPAQNVLWELDNLKTFVNGFFEVHGDATTARWTATKSRALRQLQHSVSSFLDDPVLKAKREDFKARQESKPKEKHYMMKQNPLLAGLVLFHFRAGALENGLDVVNSWGTLAVPAHLYNAIRQENISDRTWPDMEILFKTLGESRFFPGGKPTRGDTFFDRYAIQMGVSASTFSPTGRAAETRARNKKFKVAQLFAKNGSRKIENVAPVCAMFMDRYWRRTGQLSWTPEHVEEVLSYSQFDNDADGEEFCAQRIVDVQKLRERRRGKPKGAGVEVAPAQLVLSLLSALQSEALEFVFPYLCMHLMSIRFLQRISITCQESLSLPLPVAIDQREGFITYPTAAILRLAQGVNGQVNHEGLKIAAKILEAEYQNRGCVAYVVLKGGVAGWKGFGEVTVGDNMVISSVVHANPSR